MKPLNLLNKYRIKEIELKQWDEEGDDFHGWFMLKTKEDGDPLAILATNGDEWDHISISLRNRCPTWDEMELVKRLFFEPDELAIQYHVPVSDHINIHPHTLHLWRPHNLQIPLPPKIMV